MLSIRLTVVRFSLERIGTAVADLSMSHLFSHLFKGFGFRAQQAKCWYLKQYMTGPIEGREIHCYALEDSFGCGIFSRMTRIQILGSSHT